MASLKVRALAAFAFAAVFLCAVPSAALALQISEFRLRGPAGANDEFVELYNESAAAVTVSTTDGSSGWSLVASNGVARFTVPNGTTIPAHGHYLGVNSVGYSLGGYPAGSATFATANVSYTTDIPDNTGIALFNTSNAANFTLANRLDAVGFAPEANTLYREGAGISALNIFSTEHSLTRDTRTATGDPKDTGNNAADFLIPDTNGTAMGPPMSQRLGAPGPENNLSPGGVGGLSVARLDPTVSASAPPNLVRDPTVGPPATSSEGTIEIRRTITNTSGSPITRLRFRVADLTTFPSPAGVADLRPISSATGNVTLPAGPVVSVHGTTLETPPTQPNGGGLNSSMSVPDVTPGVPLAAGASISIRFLLGAEQEGGFRFCAYAEGTAAAGAVGQTGQIDSGTVPAACARAETVAPTNTVPPSISGNPNEGSTLTAADGTWSGSPAPSIFIHQWQRCGGTCTNLAGATGSTYVPVAADAGSTIRVVVTAISPSGSATATSAATAAVQPLPASLRKCKKKKKRKGSSAVSAKKCKKKKKKKK